MAEIKRITDETGKLYGFSLNGEIIERRPAKHESGELRGLANRLFNELLVIDRDESEAAQQLIREYDQSESRNGIW